MLSAAPRAPGSVDQTRLITRPILIWPPLVFPTSRLWPELFFEITGEIQLGCTVISIEITIGGGSLTDEIPRIFDGLRRYKDGVIVFQSNERISKHK
jgi:hypothetical protein